MSSSTSPQPYPSWTWTTNELGQDGHWSPPIPIPRESGSYTWDEDNKKWVVFNG